jgi:hypothetical protein
MPYIVAGIVLLFLCPSLFLTYRLGLKDGLAIQNGAKTIEPIPTPIEYVEKQKEIKEVKAQEDLISEGWNNMCTFTGKPQGVNK